VKFSFLLFLWTKPTCYLRRSESNVIEALETGTRQWVRSYLGASPGFASSCTDFVVADLSIVDLVGRRQAAGGFVVTGNPEGSQIIVC
jgi:hypothetical protein